MIDTFGGSVTLTGFDEIENSEYLPPVVRYWRRMDGLFVFNIIFDENNSLGSALLSNTDCIKLAGLAATEIKIKLGIRPKSLTSCNLLSKWRSQDWPTISLRPIKLADANELTPENVQEVLSDDARLSKLRSIPAGKTLLSEPLALFHYRRRFSDIFEKGYEVRDVLRDYRPSLARRLGLPFRLYTWHAPVVGVVLYACLLAFWHYARSSYANEHTEGGLTNEDIQRTVTDYFDNISIVCLVVLVWLMLSIVLIRRNRTLRAIQKATEILRFGNIYCCVLSNVASSSNDADAPYYTEGDFSDAIDVLTDLKENEIEKRRTNFVLIGLCILFFSVPMFNDLGPGILGEYVRDYVTKFLELRG
ncbi:hypothetical protein [Actibacterium atlanticum]|nr:hypothetical protein [Actibacterium atlanticum]